MNVYQYQRCRRCKEPLCSNPFSVFCNLRVYLRHEYVTVEVTVDPETGDTLKEEVVKGEKNGSEQDS